MSSSANSHLVMLSIPFPDARHARLAQHFSSVSQSFLAKDADAAALSREDVLYGQAHKLHTISQIPRARLVQLGYAGADGVLDKPFWKVDPAARDVMVSMIAGIHMAPISQVHPPLVLCTSIR
jgi:hypothetical protein